MTLSRTVPHVTGYLIKTAKYEMLTCVTRGRLAVHPATLRAQHSWRFHWPCNLHIHIRSSLELPHPFPFPNLAWEWLGNVTPQISGDRLYLDMERFWETTRCLRVASCSQDRLSVCENEGTVWYEDISERYHSKDKTLNGKHQHGSCLWNGWIGVFCKYCTATNSFRTQLFFEFSKIIFIILNLNFFQDVHAQIYPFLCIKLPIYSFILLKRHHSQTQ